ncbi:MAG: hypothetical protein Q9217_002616 [Psora testacea]
MASRKPLHTIVLDAGPILRNDPTVATLIAKSECLITIPSVVSEIRDQNARSRLETMLKPFLTIRIPRPQSLKFVIDFAQRSGDFSVLSRTDLEILAITYELECERNGGGGRLRKAPGRIAPNGAQPPESCGAYDGQCRNAVQFNNFTTEKPPILEPIDSANPQPVCSSPQNEQRIMALKEVSKPDEASVRMGSLKIDDAEPLSTLPGKNKEQQLEDADANKHPGTNLDSSDSEGWITPSNLKNHQAKELNASSALISEDSTLQVACITTDFAMQNVLLQIGLNLLSPSLRRIRKIRTHILRCHACFQQVKDTSKQFCPRCGKPTLTRVSCSTDYKGHFRIHLKKNMQWNHRGDRYSIPRPIPGSANGKVGQGKGGGKGGWGVELILAEDQKEYQRALKGSSGLKAKDLMDEDYLPSILTGDKGRAGGRPKVGAGRNVNAKKRIK